MELPLQIRQDQEVMAMMVYFTFLRPPKQESHHQIQFNVIPRIPFLLRGSYSSSEDAVSVL